MSMSTTIIKATAPQIPSRNTHAGSHGTVLLVEDDCSIRRYLEVILQRNGYSVLTASDGLEAMKTALGAHIDLVITDAIMPHLNGYEFCRFLRRHPRLSNVPVVLLSGLEHTVPSNEDRDRADAYLSKPVKPQDLTACLERLLVPAAA
jgi:twitching motility two-component system response regulator PilH